MNDIVTVLDLIKQMAVCVPSIIAGIQWTGIPMEPLIFIRIMLKHGFLG